MKRILICSTLVTTIQAFLIPHIQLLKELGYVVDICGNKNTKELDHMVDHVYDIPYQRTIFSLQNIVASGKLKKIVYQNNYDVIHFHTPIAAAYGRWTVREFRKQGTKVIYTAHGLHFFKGAPLKNWLLYYTCERWLARYTDALITINKEDYERVRKTFDIGRVEYIPGVGLDTKKITTVLVDKLAKRRELEVPNDAFVILSVGELNQNKNHKVIIEAIAKLKNPHIFYLICGKGSLENELRILIEKLGVDHQVKLLGFRKDIIELCKTSDIFAFPSKREGLGIAALEAMASGLPLVTSNVHGIVDYSVNGVTGYNCTPKDVDGFGKAIVKLMYDKTVRAKMGRHNIDAVKKFDVHNILQFVRQIYSNC